MINNQYFMDKYYVRVHIKGKLGGKYLTMGPYFKEKAENLANKYLSTGVCSWVEKVEK